MTSSSLNSPEEANVSEGRFDPRLASVAQRTFRNVAREWSLTDPEIAAILALPRDQPISDASLARHFGKTDALMRMSYILGIYKAINTLLPLPERANAWMRKPNSAPLFHGRSALEVLITGTTTDFRAVRAYLDAACN